MNKFSKKELDHDHLLLNLGLTIETAHQFIIVINSPICLLGKNEDCLVGFSYALTLTFK